MPILKTEIITRGCCRAIGGNVELGLGEQLVYEELEGSGEATGGPVSDRLSYVTHNKTPWKYTAWKRHWFLFHFLGFSV